MTEILFVSHQYPPSTGGMQRQSYELIKGMERHFKVHKLVHTSGSKLNFFYNLKKSVQHILRKHPKIKAIHFNDGLMAAAALSLSKACSLPFWVTLHGLDVVFASSKYQNSIFQKIAKRFRGIAVSEATKQECISRGYSMENICHINNGVDHSIAKSKVKKNFLSELFQEIELDLTNKKILLSVGRPVERKGFSKFATEVFPELSKDCVYLMAGPEFSNADKWKKYSRFIPAKINSLIVSSLGIPIDGPNLHSITNTKNSNIRYISGLSWDRLQQLYHAADLYIMPNKRVHGDMEGFGLVALEAALSKTVVIASEIEGITSAVISGKNGILLPENDQWAWVNTISELLSDKSRREETATAYQKYTLENYSWNKMVDEYAEQLAS